jgi:flagellar protein FlaJ
MAKDKEKKLLELLKKEQEEKKKAEESKDKLYKVTPTKAPEQEYVETSVEKIVKRMEKKYKERGILEEDGMIPVTKGEKLKEMVVGVPVIRLDRRTPQELVLDKNPLVKFVGKAFYKIPSLNNLTYYFSRWDMAQNLPADLNKANLNYSVTQYLSLCIVGSILGALAVSLLLLVLFFTLLSESIDNILLMDSITSAIAKLFILAMLSFFSWFTLLVILMKWPIGIARKRGVEIERNLPFALRQMATQIKAGIGIHGTLKSIVKADYGALSEEFDRVLKDIEKGKSTEDALDEMVIRSPSESLATAGTHMIRAIRTGGNLSDIISSIAEEVAFNLRMKMRDFVSKLNLVGLIYMMIGVVLPVFLAVLASVFTAVPALGMSGILGAEILFLMYFIFIPMLLGMILYFVKTFQPM